jgi:hypothetical protein
LEVKYSMSKTYMSRILASFMFLILTVTISGRDNYNLSVYKDRIYLLNGFDRTLTEYDSNGNVKALISLKNIDPSGFFDSFVRYDLFKSYLADSFKNTVYLLDEYLALEKKSDIFKEHRIKIGPKIFPVKYNSLIISSFENDRIYSIENNSVKEIIFMPEGILDFFADGSSIYLLKEQEVVIYSPEGIFRSRFNFNDHPVKFKKITAVIGSVYLLSEDGIGFIDEKRSQINLIPTENALCFAAEGENLYYFNGNDLKIIQASK